MCSSNKSLTNKISRDSSQILSVYPLEIVFVSKKTTFMRRSIFRIYGRINHNFIFLSIFWALSTLGRSCVLIILKNHVLINQNISKGIVDFFNKFFVFSILPRVEVCTYQALFWVELNKCMQKQEISIRRIRWRSKYPLFYMIFINLYQTKKIIKKI